MSEQGVTFVLTHSCYMEVGKGKEGERETQRGSKAFVLGKGKTFGSCYGEVE